MYLEAWKIAALIVYSAMGGAAVGVIIMALLKAAKSEWRR